MQPGLFMPAIFEKSKELRHIIHLSFKSHGRRGSFEERELEISWKITGIFLVNDSLDFQCVRMHEFVMLR